VKGGTREAGVPRFLAEGFLPTAISHLLLTDLPLSNHEKNWKLPTLLRGFKTY